MQMAKISSVLQIHQAYKILLYIIVLTYPTIGVVITSFGMLEDITIAKPKTYIEFVGKKVIKHTLHQKIPDDFEVVDSLFYDGLLDLIIPHNLLKGVLSEIFELYGLTPHVRTKCNSKFFIFIKPS
jgi:acetyl-CoA carboxylase carboxyl transferase subunit beta